MSKQFLTLILSPQPSALSQVHFLKLRLHAVTLLYSAEGSTTVHELKSHRYEKFQNLHISMSKVFRDKGYCGSQIITKLFLLVQGGQEHAGVFLTCPSRNNEGVAGHLEISTWEWQKKLQTDSPQAAPWGEIHAASQLRNTLPL